MLFAPDDALVAASPARLPAFWTLPFIIGKGAQRQSFLKIDIWSQKVCVLKVWPLVWFSIFWTEFDIDRLFMLKTGLI